jgi:uncharacterized membrane protein
VGQWDKLENIFEERVAKALGKLGVPSTHDIQALHARIDALTQGVGKSAPTKPTAKPAAKAAPRKTAAKPAAKSAGKSAPAKKAVAKPRTAAAPKATAAPDASSAT